MGIPSFRGSSATAVHVFLPKLRSCPVTRTGCHVLSTGHESSVHCLLGMPRPVTSAAVFSVRATSQAPVNAPGLAVELLVKLDPLVLSASAAWRV